MKRILDVFRRGKAWKDYVQASLLAGTERIAALEESLTALQQRRNSDRSEIEQLRRELANLERERDELATQRTFTKSLLLQRFSQSLHQLAPTIADADMCVLLARRDNEVVVLCMPRPAAEAKRLAGNQPAAVLSAICSDDIATMQLLVPEGGTWVPQPAQALLSLIRSEPEAAYIWLIERQPLLNTDTVSPDYFERLDAILTELSLIDFFAMGDDEKDERPPNHSKVVEILPTRVAAEPKRRSALLLHNNYYHFNCLAEALKSRGWDAITVSLEASDSPQRQFYHGEDVNLFDPDPAIMAIRTRDFLRSVPERFGSLHFSGMGLPSFFENYWENNEEPSRIPWDLLELRRHRMIIGYMPSGCLDGGLQSSIHELTNGVCNRCVW